MNISVELHKQLEEVNRQIKMLKKKKQINKPTQVEGGTISAFNDILDRPEPDKVLDVQLLTVDTVAGWRCSIMDGLKGIF